MKKRASTSLTGGREARAARIVGWLSIAIVLLASCRVVDVDETSAAPGTEETPPWSTLSVSFSASELGGAEVEAGGDKVLVGHSWVTTHARARVIARDHARSKSLVDKGGSKNPQVIRPGDNGLNNRRSTDRRRP